MKIKRREITLEDTLKILKTFEQKYKMSSIDFYLRYEQGDISEKVMNDFEAVEWASAYKTFIRLMNKKIVAEAG